MPRKPTVKKTPAEKFLDEYFDPPPPPSSSNKPTQPAKGPTSAERAREQICGLNVHPAANEFPLLSTAEMAELVESVRELGQITPVVVDGDTLLEGRNRALAVECLQRDGHKIELQTNQWEPTPDCLTPSAYIGAVNLCRRNLTDDQRAIIAARLVSHIEREQSARKLLSLIKPGEQRNPTGRNQHSRPKDSDVDSAAEVEPSPPTITAASNKRKRENSTRGKIAKQAGVSHHKADLAVRVTKTATKPEIDDVIAGKKKLAAVDREIRERQSDKAVSPPKKEAPRPIGHPFKPAGAFEVECLVAWTNIIEKKLGIAKRTRARAVFLKIFTAEENSESALPRSAAKNAPARKAPSKTRGEAVQEANNPFLADDEQTPQVADSEDTLGLMTNVGMSGADELEGAVNLWGKPRP